MEMERKSGNLTYTPWQLFSLTLLRVMVGWHFLYEGLVKIYLPGWSAKSYLQGSSGPLKQVFHAMAGNETILSAVNILNEWGLILVGLADSLGYFQKPVKSRESFY